MFQYCISNKGRRTSWLSAGLWSSFKAHVERADLSQKLRRGGYPWTEGKCSGSYSCPEWPAASGLWQWVPGWQKRAKLQVTSVRKSAHLDQKYSPREIKHIFPWSVFMQRTNSITLRMVAPPKMTLSDLRFSLLSYYIHPKVTGALCLDQRVLAAIWPKSWISSAHGLWRIQKGINKTYFEATYLIFVPTKWSMNNVDAEEMIVVPKSQLCWGADKQLNNSAITRRINKRLNILKYVLYRPKKFDAPPHLMLFSDWVTFVM